VLPRAVQERDKAEHQFVAATLEQAEDFAELMRRTIQGLRAESDPSQRPFLFGSMSYRVGLGAFGQSAEFFGWKNPCFLLCPFETTPWLGAIVPDKFAPAAAVVRRTFFAEISTELLLQVLRILEQNFGPSHGSMTSALARLILVECGLISNG